METAGGGYGEWWCEVVISFINLHNFLWGCKSRGAHCAWQMQDGGGIADWRLQVRRVSVCAVFVRARCKVQESATSCTADVWMKLW